MSDSVRIIDGRRWVLVPECAGCSAIHDTLPITRHFHSPCCPERTKCAKCGCDISGLSCEHFTTEVGAICATCYGTEGDA